MILMPFLLLERQKLKVSLKTCTWCTISRFESGLPLSFHFPLHCPSTELLNCYQTIHDHNTDGNIYHAIADKLLQKTNVCEP